MFNDFTTFLVYTQRQAKEIFIMMYFYWLEFISNIIDQF